MFDDLASLLPLNKDSERKQRVCCTIGSEEKLLYIYIYTHLRMKREERELVDESHA